MRLYDWLKIQVRDYSVTVMIDDATQDENQSSVLEEVFRFMKPDDTTEEAILLTWDYSTLTDNMFPVEIPVIGYSSNNNFVRMHFLREIRDIATGAMVCKTAAMEFSKQKRLSSTVYFENEADAVYLRLIQAGQCPHPADTVAKANR